MKSQKIMAAAIFLFLCIAIGGLYCCKTITNRTAPAPSIQYDEELSQICNHYNSGLIQQNEGIFYELESVEAGFVLCQGRSMDAIDEPMNISVASSGFWVKGGRVYYIGGDSGNELRAVNLDGTDDTLLFSVSVQDFLITGDEIIWIDKQTGNLMRFDTKGKTQEAITDFPVFFMQETDGTLSFLAEAASGDRTDYYEQKGSSPARIVISFPDYVYKYIRLHETTFAFSDNTVYMWDTGQTA